MQTTTLPLLLRLAKQGDTMALSALMNAALRDEKIRVKVILDDGCLYVMLRSLKPLNQHAAIAFVRRGLIQLEADSIHSVRAYAWHLGQDFPTWIAEFPVCLEPSNSAIAAGVVETAPAIAPLQPAAKAPQAKRHSLKRHSRSSSSLFGFGILLAVSMWLYFAVIG